MVTLDMVLFLSRIPLTQIHGLESDELIGTIIEYSSAAVKACLWLEETKCSSTVIPNNDKSDAIADALGSARN